MSVAVVVPWAPGCPWRERALDWVRAKWATEHPDWPVVLGHAGDRWAKAPAVADALTRTDADVLVVADADVWPVGGAGAAVEAAADSGWAIPHRHVVRLTDASTRELIRSGTPGATLDQPPYVGVEGGGVTVVRRDVWDRCPMDRRFTGWGQEDISWAIALRTVVGDPWRGDADLWHLWHPPQPRMNRRVGSAEGRNLFRRYWRARRDPTAMAALIEEGRP